MSHQDKWLKEKIMVLVKLGFDSMPEIVSEMLKYSGVYESSIRQMVWRLIDRGELALTESRTIEGN
jgi:hypothetical protein